jgi:type IV pilus assembly protein PilW
MDKRSHAPRLPHPHRLRGVSLIEVLVGIAIGMVAVLIMFQVVGAWDARARSSTATGDVQVAGSLATFALERDVRMAGLGFGTARMTSMGCDVQGTDTSAGTALNFPLRPVEIVDGDPGGQPDVINVLYGNSAFFVSEQRFTSSNPTDKKAEHRHGFKPGDLVVVAGNDTGAAGSATCRLVQVTDTTNVDGYTFAHTQTANYPDFYKANQQPSRYNPAGGTGAIYAGTGWLYNLGPSPRYDQWTVDPVNATLGYADLIHSSPPFTVAEGVIDMKAQYGIDTDGNGQITDAAPNEWTKAAPADWTQVRALRVALLVRSRNFEKPPSGASSPDISYVASNPQWSGGAFVMKNVDGTADSNQAGSPNNWRYYRYRVYEKVIPLRNMVWGTSP